MNVLIWRGWTPPYDPPAVYSSLDRLQLSGTDSQLLWKARNLVDLGHRVQVLGVSNEDVEEEGVQFVGTTDRAGQEAAIRTGQIVDPDGFMRETWGPHAEGLQLFKQHFPSARIVSTLHNARQHHRGPFSPFRPARDIDFFTFVGPGQFAHFCVKTPHLRHKYFLLPNAVPWKRMYKHLSPAPRTYCAGVRIQPTSIPWSFPPCSVLTSERGLRPLFPF